MIIQLSHSLSCSLFAFPVTSLQDITLSPSTIPQLHSLSSPQYSFIMAVGLPCHSRIAAVQLDLLLDFVERFLKRGIEKAPPCSDSTNSSTPLLPYRSMPLG